MPLIGTLLSAAPEFCWRIAVAPSIKLVFWQTLISNITATGAAPGATAYSGARGPIPIREDGIRCME